MTMTIDRSTWGLLRVTGTDRVRFLQGLTTINVQTLVDGGHAWGAILNPKGRVLSVIDIANIGDRFGGMLSAGLFLKEFVPEGTPWVHLDIAGPAFNQSEPHGYTPKGGTGSAVRTLVGLAEELARDAR